MRDYQNKTGSTNILRLRHTRLTRKKGKQTWGHGRLNMEHTNIKKYRDVTKDSRATLRELLNLSKLN